MSNRKEITEFIEDKLSKIMSEKEADETVGKEAVHKSAKNLRKIGNYIVDRRNLGDKVPKSIDKTTKKAYDDAVSFIEANEKDMENSNEDQKRVYAQVKDSLIKVRSSQTYEELEGRRKNLEFLKKLNDDATEDPSNEGEAHAKKYIEQLINKIHLESKPSKLVHGGKVLFKGLFSQEGTMLGSVLNEFKFIGDMLKVGIPKLSEKDRASQLESVDSEIGRLSQPERSVKAKYKPEKPVDPGIAPQKTAPNEVAPASVSGQEPIKIGNQKIYPDDPMYAKIMGQSKVSPASPAEPERITSKPLIEPKASETKPGESKTSTLIVDKLIAKNVVIEKQAETKAKPHIKLKSGSSIENKPFKSELLGEEPESASKGSLLDTAKDTILGGAIGKKLTGLGGIAKSVVRSPIGATALAGGAMLAGGAALDTGLGALGVGKDEQGQDIQINQEQDEANWKKMSAWEKIQSGAARGIEKAGKFVFLDNMANQAASERISKETSYLKDRVDTKPTMIERSATDIPKATEKVEQKARELGTPPVIIQQPASQAQNQTAPTIVPIKGSIRPNESAFNRLQDKNFK